MRFEPPTREDLDTIAEQLGRRPRDVIGIAARCPAGHPGVVVNYPVQRKKGRLVPFPTLFWLTCRELSRAISRLEMRGVIQELDERLHRDTPLAAGLRRNHELYIEQRWQILDEEDRRAVEAAGLATPLRSRGIGGMDNWQSVKCLHQHVAHHLATENVIGALLAAEHDLHPCADEL